MGVNDLSAEEEDALYRELLQWENQRYVDQSVAAEDFADKIDQLTTQAPYANPDLIMSAAEAWRDGAVDGNGAFDIIDEATRVDVQETVREAEETGGWRNTAYDWLKTGTRWTFAGLELVPQLFTNTVTRAGQDAFGGPGEAFPGQTDPTNWYKPPETDSFFDGWFASTDFGALLSGESAGNGFWIGDKAKQRQLEAVKAYRGQYAGEAITIGKGFAGTFVSPGTKPYNYLSGVVDAVGALVIPSLPGAGQLAKGVSAASRAAGVGRLAGLTKFSEPYIDYQKANRFLDTRAGNKIAERISKIDTIEEAAQVFPKTDYEFWVEVVDARNVDEVKEMLRTNIGAPNPQRQALGLNEPEQYGLGVRPGLTDVRDINLGSISPVRGFVRRGLAKSKTIQRLAAPVPGRELAIDVQNINNPYAVARELTQTITNARDYMKLVKMAPERRNEILNNLARALKDGNRAEARQIITSMTDDIIDSVATHQGVLRNYERDFLKQMFTKYQDDVEEFALYGFVDDAGKPVVLDDLVVAMADGSELQGVRLVMDTAGLTSEIAKMSTFLPDPRNLRRITSQLAPIWSKAMKNPELYGDPRTWLVATEFVMNRVFRTAMLLTGGYTTRNMLESGMRQLATPGIRTGPAHPLEWIMSMMRYKHRGTLEGEAFTQAGARMARGGLAEWDKATGAVVREMQLDPSFGQQLSFRNGVFSIAVKGTKNSDYVRGVATEIRLLASDEVARRLADGEDIADVVDWLKSDAATRYVDQISSMWSNRLLQDAQGNEFRGNVVFRRNNPTTGDIEFVDANLEKYVRQVKARLDLKTGGHDSLRQVIANGMRDGEFVDSSGKVVYAFKDGRYTGAAIDEFERFDYTGEFLDEIGRLTQDPANRLPEHVKYTKPLQMDRPERGGVGAEFIRGRVRHFFSYTFGKKEAFLNRSPVFRQFYYMKLNQLIDGDALTLEAYKTAYQNVVEAALKQPEDELRLLESLRPDKVTGRYEWNGFPIRKTEYKLRLKNARAAVERAKKNVRRNADGSYTLLDDDWAARYVGSKDLWDKIVQGSQGNRTWSMDGLSVEQASFVAKAFAMEETQKAFFNATQTSNFTDILRIGVPFGAAWKEAMGYNLKQIAMKPERVRKIEQTLRSARDSDPDNDGKGFFYTDPITKELMFNFPFGLDLLPVMVAYGAGTAIQTLVKGRGASFVAGAAAGYLGGRAAVGRVEESLGSLPSPELAAPAKSLNQSLQIFPGFGPVVQWPAGLLLRDKPQYQDILEIVAPFGGFTAITDAITPKWAQRLASAISADPENDRYFAEIYIDVGRALYNSGDYDATNEEDMLRLRKNAARAGQALLALRAIGQFTGPARPEVDLQVPSKFEGVITINDVESFVSENISTALLAATFRALQDEDYDNAVQNFLRTFGPEAAWFLPGLTSTQSENLQATDLFGEWELENSDVVNKYPKVYGYFAPIGGEFDFQTYLRQLETGKRVRTTSLQQLQQDAELIVGRALYMDAVRFAGPEIDQFERESLRAYREELKTNYPGYGTAPIDLREQYTIARQIRRMAFDADMDGNPVAEGLRLYFNQYDVAKGIADSRPGGASEASLTRMANADLRQYLRGVGNDIMRQYPEFGRVYSRVLFDEIDEFNAR